MVNDTMKIRTNGAEGLTLSSTTWANGLRQMVI